VGDNMKVTIGFIGTGKYLEYLPNYYENIKKYFLPKSEKRIIVFTDGDLEDVPNDMVCHYQKHLDWPFITLNRFEILQKAKLEIQQSDWFVFLDADTLVVDTISEEEFFNVDFPYFGVHHPCHFLKWPPHDKFPGAFEFDTESTASISEYDDTSIYFQGCLWGGKSEEVIDMMSILDANIKEDLKNDVIAQWHDESHLNKFYVSRRSQVNVLHSKYAYPELFSEYCNFEPKIVHLEKNNSQYHV
jgi:hypothetical protein